MNLNFKFQLFSNHKKRLTICCVKSHFTFQAKIIPKTNSITAFAWRSDPCPMSSDVGRVAFSRQKCLCFHFRPHRAHVPQRDTIICYCHTTTPRQLPRCLGLETRLMNLGYATKRHRSVLIKMSLHLFYGIAAFRRWLFTSACVRRISNKGSTNDISARDG